MKHYVPKLIPDRYRVLPDHFKEPKNMMPDRTTPVSSILWNTLAALLVLMALIILNVHFGFALSLVTFAFFASSWVRHRIEQRLSFRFTPSLKAGVLGILSLASVLTGFQYRHRIDSIDKQEKIVALAKQKSEAEIRRKEMLRIDSLKTYLSEADSYLKKGAYTKAANSYAQSARFATRNESNEQRRLHEGLAVVYVRTKQYKSALRQYDELASTNSLDGEQLYQRALCFQRVGSKTETLRELLKASEAGHQPAAKLYDKLNPLIRNVLYYQTVCCDGSDSPSNAKGRGACSHHGGVCNWNKPIYDTHRKYDANGL